jgi:hypothetical protein
MALCETIIYNDRDQDYLYQQVKDTVCSKKLD